MNKNLPEQKYQVILFEDKNIRRIWHEDEWFYSVVDFVQILTDSTNPRDYWYKVKTREEENGIQLSTNCRQLKLKAPDGKMRETDCANNEGLLRVIQSIPSKKAEPIKLWLAQIGRERLEEIQNPNFNSAEFEGIKKNASCVIARHEFLRHINQFAFRSNLSHMHILTRLLRTINQLPPKSLTARNDVIA